MGYYIDLANISLENYRDSLELADLLPSRMVLKSDLKQNFEILKAEGITNVAELLNSVKSKKKVLELAKKTTIDEEYLIILARELKSYQQKPNELKNFPGISETTLQALESVQIKNTLQLYDRALTKESRNQLTQQLGIPAETIATLTKLSDLSRIRWVNHTFAYVLFEAGYQSASQIAHANHIELYKAVKQLNDERKIFKGNIGQHDMKLCVEAAKDLSLDIEF